MNEGAWGAGTPERNTDLTCRTACRGNKERKLMAFFFPCRQYECEIFTLESGPAGKKKNPPTGNPPTDGILGAAEVF